MKRRDFARLIVGFGGAAMIPGTRPLEALAPGAAVRAPRPPWRDGWAGSDSHAPPSTRRWSFVADVAECCTCAIPCPCNFGRPVETCFGNRLIRIREGEMAGENLAGISFLVTFHMGRWTRIYVDETLDERRSTAFDALLPVAFAGFNNLARQKIRVPLIVEGTDEVFRFAVPESAVEMRRLPGIGGGPIRIDGLPSPVFYNYVQYESVVHRHASPDGDWSVSRTNGFRSEMRASG